MFRISGYEASFTKWDTSLSGTLQAGPMGVPLSEVLLYMKEQFDPTIYIVRERHKFWSDMIRKPGETIHELTARIRQDAVTCEFATIKDPQDEALRTRFLCSVNNEAVLKATFRVKDEELTFTKAVAIANETEDAYNQVQLAPESQKRLALSTHRGVLLQCRLPFGIKSSPGYFQQIMEQLTSDLKGVAVYLDDILVSGKDAQEHLQNLRVLLRRLDEKGLRCRREKCVFAQPMVEYLGHLLSKNGVAKGTKVDAVKQMPRPQDVASVKSFLGSIQFYSKFILNLSTITEPLHLLTKCNVPWSWTTTQESAFKNLKHILSREDVLAHFNPNQEIGISCDASEVGIGAVLFHCYNDGSECPIANASKTLTDTQRRYSQIQKEALSIVFTLHK